MVIVNPQSREGEGELGPGLELLREAGIEPRLEYTGDPVAVLEIIRGCGDAEVLILGGGDGTLHAALPAVLDSGLPLGILPMGTANDLARTLGIPKPAVEACRIIAGGRVHRIDLGWVNGHLFFNAANIGLGVQVTHRLSREVKQRWGILAYPRVVLQALRENRSFVAEIVCDGEVRRHRSIQVAVGNGRHYGGGLTIAEEARIDDHRLHLYSLQPQGLWSLLRLAPALRSGRYPDRRQVQLLSGAAIEVRTRVPLPVVTDGEPATRTPARFRVLEACLPVFVPHDYGTGDGE